MSNGNEIPTGLACPTCRNGGQGILAMLFARPGTFMYYCRSKHEFNDMQELLALNPEKIQIPQKQTIQQGYETMQLSIPTELREKLVAKFGTPERITQTLGSVLRALIEPRVFLFNAADITRIHQMSGQEPKSAAELVGMLYEKIQTVNELTAQVKSRNPVSTEPAAQSLPEGSVAVNLSPILAKINSIAKFRGQTVNQVVEETLALAVNNGWV